MGAELLLDAAGGLVQCLSGAPAAAVARFEWVAEDDVDPAAQRGQRLGQPAGPLGASQHRHRDDRGSAAHREVREPGPQRGEVALAPGALREDPEDPAGGQDAEGVGDGRAVGDLPVDLQLADAQQERVERADERLLLDQEVRGPGDRR